MPTIRKSDSISKTTEVTQTQQRNNRTNTNTAEEQQKRPPLELRAQATKIRQFLQNQT